MPGRPSNSPLGKGVGAAAAGLAVVLLALDQWTDLTVPYGYDSDSLILFFVGATVAVIAVAVTGYRYLSGE